MMVSVKQKEKRRIFLLMLDEDGKPIDYTEEDWVFTLVIKKTKGQETPILEILDGTFDKTFSDIGLIGFTVDLAGIKPIPAGDYLLELKVDSEEWNFTEISPTITFRVVESCF